MDPTYVEAAFVVTPKIRGAFSWDANATQVRFSPDLLLGYGTTYAVSIAPQARDANGAFLDGDGDGVGGDGYALSFTTEPDVEPPRVLAVTPNPGATNVSVSAVIEVRFSEPMDRAFVEDAFSFSDGTTTWGAVAGWTIWSGAAFADDTLTFDGYANFPFSATLTFALNGSVARDPAGFTIDGDGDGVAEGSPTDDVAWTFRTEATDATRPWITYVDPPDGAVDVPVTTVVFLRFSEPMDRATVEDAFSLRDDVRTWTKADGWFSWASEVLWYTPSTNLAFDREYTVTVSTAAEDGNENPLDGGGAGGNFTATFRTLVEPDLAPPHVVSTIPAPWQQNVPRDVRFSITFDDAMDRVATEFAISMEAVTTLEPVPVPVGEFSWDAGDHAVSFRPVNWSLAWGAAYDVHVSMAAKDDAGNVMASPFSFTFQVAPWTGQVVGRVVGDAGPLAGATVRLGTATTLTGANGTVSFPNAQAGMFPLTISAAGYQSLHETVVLDQSMAVENFTLIDLGEFRLASVQGLPVGIAAGVILATVAAVAVVALLLRRRRIPEEAFEGMGGEP